MLSTFIDVMVIVFCLINNALRGYKTATT